MPAAAERRVVGRPEDEEQALRLTYYKRWWEDDYYFHEAVMGESGNAGSVLYYYPFRRGLGIWGPCCMHPPSQYVVFLSFLALPALSLVLFHCLSYLTLQAPATPSIFITGALAGSRTHTPNPPSAPLTLPRCSFDCCICTPYTRRPYTSIHIALALVPL